MTTDVDLTLVQPDRRPEVLRRILLAERFLREPGRQTAERFAAELGIGVAQFYNVVRSWRDTARPELLPGAAETRSRATSMSTTQLEIVDRIVADNPSMLAADMFPLIVVMAQTSGVSLPHRDTVVAHVRNSRPSFLPPGEWSDADVVVDHAVLDLPVVHDGTSTRPLATMAIDPVAGAITGIALSIGTPDAATTARALLRSLMFPSEVGHAMSRRHARVVVVARALEETNALIRPLAAAGVRLVPALVGAHGAGRHVEALLGDRPSGIRLRPRLVWATGDRRSTVGMRGGGRPMSRVDAEGLVAARLVGPAVERRGCQQDQDHSSTLIAGLTAIVQAAGTGM